jgi:hypothetical protein
VRYGLQWLAANWVGGESGATASKELLTLFGPQFLKTVHRYVQISGLSAPREGMWKGRSAQTTLHPAVHRPYIKGLLATTHTCKSEDLVLVRETLPNSKFRKTLAAKSEGDFRSVKRSAKKNPIPKYASLSRTPSPESRPCCSE